jgi:Fe-S-cluster containining protein
MGYKLPLLVERSVGEAQAARIRIVSEFEHRIRRQAVDAKKPITCQKGCSHCCYYPITLSLLDGISLFRWLAETRLWSHSLKKSLQEMADHTLNLSFEVWTLSMIPCPFLDEQQSLCRIYEARPFTCRLAFSVGDPYFCHPHRMHESTGMVSRKETLEELATIETAILKRHGLGLVRVPLSSAILYGERVCKKDMDLEEVGRHLWQEYMENG